ncbi:glycoside hydrolase family 16 protein [Artomyces pyxidatus]|uniref:Glycoside hydrolase family 16 protein n=1 Tax=Artomyces pyxidatus TaxID=48021 RepID=A0ACB8T3J7_9AGAM|nr:glycoside hydrolase family 16 protein [Artomyces pyxidatus]
MVSSKLATVLALAIPGLVGAQSYNLVKSYAGSTFFDDWTFYGNYDNLTNGDAIFVTEEVAAAEQLAYVNPAGNAIIKVDNTTNVVWNNKRNTVRIASKDAYSVGSVWIADMLHVPFGCSVWPAFWSQAANWPAGGEIDTFEGVNMVQHSQSALHTEPGCTIANAVQTSTLVNSTDCSYLDNENEGCQVTNPDPSSYGAAFAAAGGGVFVTEFAESGISIWFYSRKNVPANLLTGNSVSTSSLGTPTVNYPATGCAIDKYFQPQNLIFDITLCGDLAGNNATFAQTCTGVCYNDYVIGPPSGYNNAYFEVSSVRVFTAADNSTGGSGGSSSNSSSSSGSSGSSKPNGAVGWAAGGHAIAAFVMAAAIACLFSASL